MNGANGSGCSVSPRCAQTLTPVPLCACPDCGLLQRDHQGHHVVPDREDPVAQRGAAAGQPPLRVFLRRPLLQRRYDSLPLVHPNRLLKKGNVVYCLVLFGVLLWFGYLVRFAK